ncbi:hypothetical protein DSECCO2_356600 [anaerobic digester metagenome]|jgi:hypothetical protein
MYQKATSNGGFFKVLATQFVHLSKGLRNAESAGYTKIGFLLHYADKYPKIDA